MKPIATGRFAQAAGKYAEHAPMATACCNACRTCVQTNVVGLAVAGTVALASVARGVARRFAKPRRQAVERSGSPRTNV
jgi:hypothetical protein